jgi:nitrogenase molybdenum-iron protein beta chain
VVLTGCTADIIGDDVEEIVSEYRDRGIPIVCAETGGFRGSNFKGHEMVVEAIIDQFIGEKRVKVKRGLVNVWSVLPYQDSFWTGNLLGIKKLLQGIGLKVNILFGTESKGVNEWKTIPDAQFNLVLSPWVGLNIAKHLEKKYGTPYLHYPILPIGAKETGKFLRTVAEFAQLDRKRVEEFIEKEEKRFYYYIERSLDFFIEFRYDMADRFFNITDSFYALGISKFLVNELGIVPGQQYITDDTPEKYRHGIKQEFVHLSDTFSSKVIFEIDGGKIHESLRKYPLENYRPLILGSSWDRDIASELNGFWINISIPVLHRLVLNRSYVGYSGGLTLMEDIYSSILNTYK